MRNAKRMAAALACTAFITGSLSAVSVMAAEDFSDVQQVEQQQDVQQETQENDDLHTPHPKDSLADIEGFFEVTNPEDYGPNDLTIEHNFETGETKYYKYVPNDPLKNYGDYDVSQVGPQDKPTYSFNISSPYVVLNDAQGYPVVYSVETDANNAMVMKRKPDVVVVVGQVTEIYDGSVVIAAANGERYEVTTLPNDSFEAGQSIMVVGFKNVVGTDPMKFVTQYGYYKMEG